MKIKVTTFDVDKMYGFFYQISERSGKLTVLRDNSRIGRQNQIIDLMRGIYENEKTTYEILAAASVYDQVFEAYEKEMEITSKDAKLNAPQTNNTIRNNMLLGKALVGPFANANSIIGLFQQAQKLLISPFVNEDGTSFKRGFMFNDYVHNDFTGIQVINPDRYKYRTQNIALWLAAIVDNGKNPFAAKLNVNWATINEVVALLSAGVNMDTTMHFINHPVIRLYGKLYNFYGANELAKVQATRQIDNLLKIDHKKLYKPKDLKVQDLRDYSKLARDGKLIDSLDGIDSEGVWSSFKTYSKYANPLSELTSMLKVAEGGVGGSDGKTISVDLRLKSVMENDILTGHVELLKDNTKVHNYFLRMLSAQVSDITTPTVIDEFADKLGFPRTNAGIYMDIISELNEMKLGTTDNNLTEKEVNDILNGFNSYIISKNLDLGNEENVNDKLRSVTELFKSKRKEHKEYKDLFDNFFIDESLVGKEDYLFFKGVTGQNKEETRRLERMMQALYLKDPDFVFELAEYSFLLDGYAVSPFGFSNLIPNQYYIDSKVFDNNLATDLDTNEDPLYYQTLRNDFIKQFIQNKARYLNYIPKFDIKYTQGSTRKEGYYYQRGGNKIIYVPLEGDYQILNESGISFDSTVRGRHFNNFYNPIEIIEDDVSTVEPRPEIFSDFEPQEIDEFAFDEIPEIKILNYLKGIKLNTKSVVEETGLKVGVKSDINPIWVNNSSRETISSLSEDIANEFNMNEMEVKNTLIEILAYSPTKYRKELESRFLPQQLDLFEESTYKAVPKNPSAKVIEESKQTYMDDISLNNAMDNESSELNEC